MSVILFNIGVQFSKFIYIFSNGFACISKLILYTTYHLFKMKISTRYACNSNSIICASIAIIYSASCNLKFDENILLFHELYNALVLSVFLLALQSIYRAFLESLLSFFVEIYNMTLLSQFL